MKKIINTGFILFALCIAFTACVKRDPIPVPAGKYPSDVATSWIKMQMRLTMSTPGFNSVVASRLFGYAGLTLHEAIVPALSNGHSLARRLNDGNALSLLLPPVTKQDFHSPASVNAAMATITKLMFANTSAANVNSIDSLEQHLRSAFIARVSEKQLENSERFGHKVAKAIYEWSKTDGAHEPYLHVTFPNYIPPVGPGLWIPTPPAMSAAIHPYWGKNRPFVIQEPLTAPVPMPYSTAENSPYYKQANDLYKLSLNLTREDSTIARFWGDLAVNYNVPAHATGILTQLIILKNFKLDEAAIAYAKHGFALTDAIITVFHNKYHYNTIRPISYIRSVLKQPNWNTVIPTPPHPEYPAAHALASGASAVVMEDLFGRYLSFTDHTYDQMYGARSFTSFDDYAREAGHSRVLAGIHYPSSVAAGLAIGRQVGEQIVAVQGNAAYK